MFYCPYADVCHGSEQLVRLCLEVFCEVVQLLVTSMDKASSEILFQHCMSAVTTYSQHNTGTVCLVESQIWNCNCPPPSDDAFDLPDFNFFFISWLCCILLSLLLLQVLLYVLCLDHHYYPLYIINIVINCIMILRSLLVYFLFHHFL